MKNIQLAERATLSELLSLIDQIEVQLERLPTKYADKPLHRYRYEAEEDPLG